MEFQELLVKVASELDKQSIPYMVIGGQAVLLHGEPRFTRDIDITLGIDIDELKKIQHVIQKLNLRPLPQNPESFVQETRALPVIDENTGVRVDFVFTFIPFERQAIQRSQKVAVGGYPVAYVSVEDLVIYKITAGRPVDLEDVGVILRKNKVYDKAYIVSWLKDFGEVLGKPLAETFESVISNLKIE